MKVLTFGTYNKVSHPRVAVLIEGLRSRGHEVVELNSPLKMSTSERVASLSSLKAALHAVGLVLSCWGRLILGSFSFRGTNSPDVVIVGYLGHLDVLIARLLFPTKRIVLDHLVSAADTASDRRLAHGSKQAILHLLDWMAMRAASIIMLDTYEDLELLVPKRWHGRSVVVPVGAPSCWYEARQDKRPANSKECVSITFFGLFTPLQGAPVIAQALRLLDERGVRCNVNLIGRGQDSEQCREVLGGLSGNVNLTWTDWLESDVLPAVVAQSDICLGIFGKSSKAQRVVPNKAFQGMAAGCAVVTSNTPVQRHVLKRAVFTRPGDPEDLARALENLIADRARLEEVKECCAAQADEAFHPYSVTCSLDKVLR